MKRVNKRILAVFMAFAIVIGTIFSFKIDSEANSIDIDCDMSSKTISLNVRPYGGLKREDVICWDSTLFFSDIALKLSDCSLIDKLTGEGIGEKDELVAGKTYHYFARIESVENPSKPHAAVDISKYNINVINYVITSDNSPFSNIKITSGTYSRTLECDITIKNEPNYNLGTLTVDFTKDNTTFSIPDSRVKHIIEYLSYESLDHHIGHYSGSDYDDFDLDNDGKYDVRGCFINDVYSITKLGTCSLTKTISFTMAQSRCEENERTYQTYYAKIIFDFTKNSSNNNNSSNNSGSSSNSGSGKSKGTSYKNEWVKGQWYDANGGTSYTAKGSWKSNNIGWWFEDSKGWYPHSQWQKIDGKWYYFTENGYMDYSECRDGCWLGADGAWDENYSGGHWMSDSYGWWYEDTSGWYPSGQWLWIDGLCYYFKVDGYMAVNQYIDGCWVNDSGVWVR